MPTIFDASAEEQKKKQHDVEQELAEIKEVVKQKSVSSEEEPDPASKKAAPSETEPVKTKKKHSRRNPHEYSSFLRTERPNNGAFSAFMPQPSFVHFETQHESEQILLVLRQHPVINLVWMFLAVVLVLAPFFLFPLIPLQIVLPDIYLFFLMIAWYLFVTAFIIENFLGWYFNIYVITDERIIDIDFYSLIYKSVSEAKLDKIEDVTATTAGFFGAFFNFGNITIQTAAEKREFEFQRVPQPAKITKFLNELMLEEEREKIEGRVM